MAQYTEVEKGKSGAEAETEEIDLRDTVEIAIRPNRDGNGVEVIHHFKQHKPDMEEFGPDEGEELIDYLIDCIFEDEEEK